MSFPVVRFNARISFWVDKIACLNFHAMESAVSTRMRARRCTSIIRDIITLSSATSSTISPLSLLSLPHFPSLSLSLSSDFERLTPGRSTGRVTSMRLPAMAYNCVGYFKSLCWTRGGSVISKRWLSKLYGRADCNYDRITSELPYVESCVDRTGVSRIL